MIKKTTEELRSSFGPPRAVLRTGTICNHRCQHCITTKEVIELGEFSLEQIKSMVDSFPKDAAPNSNFLIFGGEPTVRSDLIEILDYVRNKGYAHALLTNGNRFENMEYAKELAPHLDVISIPIHSSNMQVFDKITRVPGSGAKVIQGIKNLLEIGFSNIVFNMIITQLNYTTLPETFDFIQKLFPGSLMQMSFCTPLGAADNVLITPKYRDVQKYVSMVLKKYAYLIYPLSFPDCLLYPYLSITNPMIVYIPEPEYDYKTGSWPIFNFHATENMNVKSYVCKECIFNDTCAGVAKRYVEVYSESDCNFSLSDDLIPIKFNYKNFEEKNPDIQFIPILDNSSKK